MDQFVTWWEQALGNAIAWPVAVAVVGLGLLWLWARR